jgi:hypothetical protein
MAGVTEGRVSTRDQRRACAQAISLSGVFPLTSALLGRRMRPGLEENVSFYKYFNGLKGVFHADSE